MYTIIVHIVLPFVLFTFVLYTQELPKYYLGISIFSYFYPMISPMLADRIVDYFKTIFP